MTSAPHPPEAPRPLVVFDEIDNAQPFPATVPALEPGTTGLEFTAFSSGGYPEPPTDPMDDLQCESCQ